MEIEEPAPPADDAGSSASTSAFLSADKPGVPELSVPRSPCPAAEEAAVVLVQASAGTEMARQGGSGLNGKSEGLGVGGGGSARRQVSGDVFFVRRPGGKRFVNVT